MVAYLVASARWKFFRKRCRRQVWLRACLNANRDLLQLICRTLRVPNARRDRPPRALGMWRRRRLARALLLVAPAGKLVSAAVRAPSLRQTLVLEAMGATSMPALAEAARSSWESVARAENSQAFVAWAGARAVRHNAAKACPELAARSAGNCRSAAVSPPEDKERLLNFHKREGTVHNHHCLVHRADRRWLVHTLVRQAVRSRRAAHNNLAAHHLRAHCFDPKVHMIAERLPAATTGPRSAWSRLSS